MSCLWIPFWGPSGESPRKDKGEGDEVYCIFTQPHSIHMSHTHSRYHDSDVSLAIDRQFCFPPFVLPAICASRREELTQTRLSSLAGVAASAMSNWLTRHYHISRPFGTFPFLQICHTPISPNLKFEFVTLPSPPHIVTHVLLAVQAPAAADTRKAPSR